MKKNIFFLSVLFFATLVLNGCTPEKEGAENVNPADSSESSSSEALQESEDANAKTRTDTNEYAGYRITLPMTYVPNTDDSGKVQSFVYQKNGKLALIVRTRVLSSPGDSYFDTEASEEITVNNQKWTVHKFPKGYCDGPGCSDPFIAFKTQSEEMEYALEFYNVQGLNAEIRAILENFEFIK